MAGIIFPPIAEVVAGADPEIAPKNILASTVTFPRPPAVCPVKVFAILTRRSVSPPRSIRSPASMKQGTAKIGSDSCPVYIAWEIKLTSMVP